ncbi:MAG: pentapeptide repeat-containing protein [Anaerolineae bacterium]|nr:pentapeptide repeat-containing protein [Anaerolineae bacterium]
MSRKSTIWLHKNPFHFSLPQFVNLISAAAFVGIWIHLQRQQNQSDERTLLQAVGNPGFSPAAAAVMQLYREGRLSGETSILRGKNLMGANWQNVKLPEVDLEEAKLSYVDLRDSLLFGANLTKVDFRHANLSGANLIGAKIPRASFMEADLRRTILNAANGRGVSLFMARAAKAVMTAIQLENADLQEADLHGAKLNHAFLSNSLMRDTNLAEADLTSAILEGAKMINANLRGANLTKTHFNEKTILPDAEFVKFGEDDRAVFDKYWTPETDMTRYTDPNHPHFWQPKWAQSDWVKRNYTE